MCLEGKSDNLESFFLGRLFMHAQMVLIGKKSTQIKSNQINSIWFD